MPAIRRARGRLILISSTAAGSRFRYTGAYHASKYGIEAIGDSLRQELAPWGIKVVLILPGAIDTADLDPRRGRRRQDLRRVAADAGALRLETDDYREFIHEVAKAASRRRRWRRGSRSR